MQFDLLRSTNSFSAPNPYNQAVGFNLKNFGADIGGDWNEPDYDYSGAGTPVANAISLIDGSTTGMSIAYGINSGTPAGDTSGNTTAATANIPAPGYDRGAEVEASGSFSLQFSVAGITNYRISIGLYVNTTKYTTENGTVEVTDGFGTQSQGFSCTTPVEVQFEAVAAGGVVDLIVSASAGAGNGVGCVAVKIEWIV